MIDQIKNSFTPSHVNLILNDNNFTLLSDSIINYSNFTTSIDSFPLRQYFPLITKTYKDKINNILDNRRYEKLKDNNRYTYIGINNDNVNLYSYESEGLMLYSYLLILNRNHIPLKIKQYVESKNTINSEYLLGYNIFKESIENWQVENN